MGFGVLKTWVFCKLLRQLQSAIHLILGVMVSMLFLAAMPDEAEAQFTSCPTISGVGEQLGVNFTDDNCFDVNGAFPAGVSGNEDFLFIEVRDGVGGTNFNIQEGGDDARDLVVNVGGSTLDADGSSATNVNCTAGCLVTGTHGGVAFTSFTYTSTGASGSVGGSAPEISVSSSEGGAVLDGGTDTFTSTPAAGSASTVTYTITNSGTDTLTVTTPTVGGNVTSTSNVTVNSLTLGSTSVAAGGGTTTLVVNYTPTAAGAFSFAFNFVNTDADESPFNITASGSASGAPEISVSSSEGGAVLDGGTDTFTSTPAAGSSSTVTYTITNSGTDTLTVTTPTVGGNVTSTSNVTVNSLTLGSTSVAAGGGTTTLVVNYTPTAGGAFSFTYSLANNDADENPFDVTASGAANSVASTLIATSGSGQVTDINTAFGAPLVATVTDGSGNGVPNINVTFTAPANGASLTFASTNTNTETVTTDVNGVATSSTMTANSTSSSYLGGRSFAAYSVMASSTGLTGVTYSLTNNLDSATNVTKTQEVIASFVTDRADRIVSEQPNLVNRLIGGPFGQQQNINSFAFDISKASQSVSFDFSFRAFANKLLNSELRPQAEQQTDTTPDRFAFFDELETSKPQAYAQTSETGNTRQALALDGDDIETQAFNTMPQSGFDFWAKGTFAVVENGNNDSRNGIFFAGVDYRYKDATIFGLMGQLDISDQTNRAANTSADGIGWMFGPYAVFRLHENLYVDGRAAYGQSYNNVNALGLFTDDFETQRVLFQGGLTGDFTMGDVTFNPFVKATYFWEKQASYTDTLGNFIPSQDFDLGRLEFGPEVTFNIRGQDTYSLALFMAFSGIYDFNQLQETPSTDATLTSSVEDLRARVEAGAAMRLTDSKVELAAEGFYDGIGADDFQAYGGSFSVNVPF